jgi:guanine deaminase
MPQRRALRGRLLSFIDDPAEVGEAASYVYLEDGVLLIEDGRIAARGEASALLPRLPAGTPIDDHSGHIILAGLIDLHLHLPQTQVIASHGAQLLDWLQKYTFVEEQKFGDPAHAERIATFFLDELLRHGTTTAVVYGSVHPESAEALFAQSERRGTRMIAGKVMMDRGAPEALLDTAQRGYDESKALLERWHGRGRQH